MQTPERPAAFVPERASLCACGHPKANHADCGTGPCRSNVSLALWHDGNDRKSAACPCRSHYEPVETQEVES